MMPSKDSTAEETTASRSLRFLCRFPPAGADLDSSVEEILIQGRRPSTIRSFGSSHSPSSTSCLNSRPRPKARRSEEHTSELQSLRHLVCRLLLEKKKRNDPHLQPHSVTYHTLLVPHSATRS